MKVLLSPLQRFPLQPALHAGHLSVRRAADQHGAAVSGLPAAWRGARRRHGQGEPESPPLSCAADPWPDLPPTGHDLQGELRQSPRRRLRRAAVQRRRGGSAVRGGCHDLPGHPGGPAGGRQHQDQEPHGAFLGGLHGGHPYFGGVRRICGASGLSRSCRTDSNMCFGLVFFFFLPAEAFLGPV